MKRRKFLASSSLMGLMTLPLSMPHELRDEKAAPQTRTGGVKLGSLMEHVRKFRKLDSHAHVFFNSDSPAAQIELADRLNIEKMVISRPMAPGSEGKPEEFIACNDLILEAMKAYPTRFIGQPTVNPAYSQKAMDELERCHDLGMVGVKLYNHVKINDPRMYPLIERMIEKKMIILMHMGIGRARVQLDPREPANISLPEDFADIGQRYPEAMVQLAHLGGGGDWMDACKAVAPHPNIYADLSGSNNDAGIVPYALKCLGIDRLFFGCDNSFFQGVGQILAADLSDKDKERLFFTNYNNILALSGNGLD